MLPIPEELSHPGAERFYEATFWSMMRTHYCGEWSGEIMRATLARQEGRPQDARTHVDAAHKYLETVRACEKKMSAIGEVALRQPETPSE